MSTEGCLLELQQPEFTQVKFSPSGTQFKNEQNLVSDRLHISNSWCPIKLSINVIKWAGDVARMGEDRCVQRVLVGKPEGNRPLGRPRRGWEDNIKMDLQEVGGGRGDWMELFQDRDRWRALVGTMRDFRVP